MEPFIVTLAGYIAFCSAVILTAGTLYALFHKKWSNESSRKPYFLLLIVTTVVGFISITNTGAIKEERLRSERFAKYCETAHITVYRTVVVRSAYFDPDGCSYRMGYLDTCERPAYRRDIHTDKPYEREYGGGSRIVERIKEPEAEYAVLVKPITNDTDRKLGIGGSQKTILNRITGEILAEATFYSINRLPYPRCPEAGVEHLELYVLGYAPQDVQKRIENEILKYRVSREKK